MPDSFGQQMTRPSQEDQDLLARMESFQVAEEERKQTRRTENWHRHAQALLSPFKNDRRRAAERVAREVTDPEERQWLVEDVANIAHRVEQLQIKEYNEKGFIGRWANEMMLDFGFLGEKAKQAHGAFRELGKLSRGKKLNQKDVQFYQALEQAQQGNNPWFGQTAPWTTTVPGEALGLVPDVAATTTLSIPSAGLGGAAYWTAREFPEIQERLIAEGLSQAEAAPWAGTVSAAIGLSEMLQPTKGLGKIGPLKGMKGKLVSAIVKKVGLTGKLAKRPVIRKAIKELGEATLTASIETGVEGAQEAAEASALVAVSKLKDHIPDRSAEEIWEAAKAGVQEAAGPMGLLALVGAGGRIGGEYAQTKAMKVAKKEMRYQAFTQREATEGKRRKARDLEHRETEVLKAAAADRVPSRAEWKQWGLAEAEGRTAEQRKDTVKQLAADIRSLRQVEALETGIPPTREQWNLFGFPKEEGITEAKRQAYLENRMTDARSFEERILSQSQEIENQEVASEISQAQAAAFGEEAIPTEQTAAEQAAQATDAAMAQQPGFLASETGAMAVEGIVDAMELERPGVLRERMKSVNPEVDRRREKAYGAKLPSIMERLKNLPVTVSRYVTRTYEHLPAFAQPKKWTVAKESLRLLKAIRPAAINEAVNTVGAIIGQLPQEQFELFEKYIDVRNRLATSHLGLREGYESLEEVQADYDNLERLVNALPTVREALDTRKQILDELVGRLVDSNLVPKENLENTETYFHQQVHMYREAWRRFGGAGKRPRKRSFMKRRKEGVTGEEYDYNTSYIESEVAWMADAHAALRENELFSKMMQEYDVSEDMKDMANNEGTTVEDLVRQDKDLTFWQLRPGHVWYPATTIPEKIAEGLQKGIVDEITLTRDDLRRTYAIGAPHKRYILPTELADQLDTMTKKNPNWLDSLHDEAIAEWKAWTLLNPTRIFGYNVRNFTGDFDPVFATFGFDKQIYSNSWRAMRELAKYHGKTVSISPELRGARDHGVIGSGFSAAEIGEVGQLPIFRRLGKKNLRISPMPIKGYMQVARGVTELREDVLRYATYLTYLERIKKGDVRHYGTSRKIVVEQVRRHFGNEAAAAHMARNLLGDYQNLTILGNWLRNRLMPFYAFQEINFKRYPRLMKNAIEAGAGRRFGVALALAGAMRIGAFYAGQWAWNNLMAPLLFGDDDEEDLTGHEKASPHINLGSNPDGTKRVFRNVGALGDLLEWFGINEAIAMVDEYKAKQVDEWDVIQEMLKAPLEKAVNMVRPDIKGIGEILIGETTYPSVFERRAIERDVAATNILGLGDTYKWMKGKVLKSGERARPHYWQRWFFGVVDPRQQALSEMYTLRADFLKRKGESDKGIYPISEYKIARDAAAAEDYDAFVEWKRRFQERHPDLEGTKRFFRWLDGIDPIAKRLNETDEYEFETNFLTYEQRQKLKVAREYSMELRDLLTIWWDADEAELEEPPQVK